MKNLILFFGVLSLFSCGNSSNEGKTAPAATAETTVATAEGDVAKMLEGTWVSVQDAKSVIKIGDGKIVDIYDGKNMDSRKFEYSATCEGNACREGKTPKGCFSSLGEFDAECFSVINVSSTDLETALVGGPGKSNFYKKTK